MDFLPHYYILLFYIHFLFSLSFFNSHYKTWHFGSPIQAWLPLHSSVHMSAVSPCVKIQTSTAMQRGGVWEAVISQKHTTSFESRVTYKQHSQPTRALFRLIVAISSSSVGTSPFPLKCLWPIMFQWHSDMGPGQTHNKHWHKHILAGTHIFQAFEKRKKKKSWPTTSVTYSLLSAQWQYISQCSIISCPQIWSHGSFIWKEITLLLHFQWGEKSLEGYKTKWIPLQFVSKKCSVCTFCLLIKQETLPWGSERHFGVNCLSSL